MELLPRLTLPRRSEMHRERFNVCLVETLRNAVHHRALARAGAERAQCSHKGFARHGSNGGNRALAPSVRTMTGRTGVRQSGAA